jgi:biotin transporter BioY
VPGVSKLGHIGGFIAGGLATLAIAGLPWDRRRLPAMIQVAGLCGVLVVLLVGIAWRTAVIA